MDDMSSLKWAFTGGFTPEERAIRSAHYAQNRVKAEEWFEVEWRALSIVARVRYVYGGRLTRYGTRSRWYRVRGAASPSRWSRDWWLAKESWIQQLTKLAFEELVRTDPEARAVFAPAPPEEAAAYRAALGLDY